MRVALDTNILAYAEGVNAGPLKETAIRLVQQLSPPDTFIPVQVLGELFGLLVRKAQRSQRKARAAILGWRDAFSLIETSESVLLAATELAADHRLHIWDALIVSAAAAGGCRLLLSEDLQDGFTWSGVTIANPFAPSPQPILKSLFGTRE